jgi:cytoskeleton protein RodZ
MKSNSETPLPFDGVGEDSIPELVRLGDQLTRAREAAGLSLDALGKRLRVEPRLLQALERGDHNKLPEGVFIVALARRIAETLNVNLEEGIVGVRQSRLMERRPAGPAKASGDGGPDLSASPSEAIRNPPRPTPSLARRRSIPLWGWPLAALLTTLGATAAWLLLAPSPSRGPSASPELAPTPAPAPEQAIPQPSSLQPTQGTKAGSISSNTPAADTLRLQANEPSWLEVRDANGKTIFEGTLNGERSFPLGRGLEVMTGRPHAVRAAIGPGQATPIGGVNDIRWKRFSPKVLTPAAPPPPTPSP